MSKLGRKFKKQKRRERENKRQKLRDRERRLHDERRRRYRELYPEFRFDTTAADPEFVEAVRQSVATINFEDRSHFPAWQTELCRLLKQGGVGAVREALLSLKAELIEQEIAESEFVDLSFFLNLGQAVLNRIPAATRERHLPMSDVMIAPRHNYLQVICRSLCRAKGAGRTIYYSRRKPTLDINGEPKIVAFSKHAIDRTSERIKPNSTTSYGALGDTFALFDQCTYFERCTLHRDQLGFSFFDRCTKGCVTHWYVDEVLGADNVDPKRGQPYYRVGYCPAVVEGDIVKAMTLLLPGYANTPECSAIWDHANTRTEREELLARSEDWQPRKLYETHDFSLLKWFHDHGVPQVVHLNGKVYEKMWE